MKVKFKCPECAGTGIEEVMVNVTQSSVVTDADQLDSGHVALEYELWDVDGGEVARYQCARCGFIPTDPHGQDISHPEVLYTWLLAHDMLEESTDE